MAASRHFEKGVVAQIPQRYENSIRSYFVQDHLNYKKNAKTSTTPFGCTLFVLIDLPTITIFLSTFFSRKKKWIFSNLTLLSTFLACVLLLFLYHSLIKKVEWFYAKSTLYSDCFFALGHSNIIQYCAKK